MQYLQMAMSKKPFFSMFICLLLPLLVPAQAGFLDPSFSNDGSAITSFLSGGHASASDVAVLLNGRILVVGGTWQPSVDISSQIALLRYMPDGTIDETFGNNGKKMVGLPNLNAEASKIWLLPDGKFLCAGSAWNNEDDYFLLARFNADGSPDPAFDGDGILLKQVSNFAQYGNALVVQPDGKILLGGIANITGYLEPVVWRFHANGTVDNSFGGGAGFVHTPLGDSYAGVEEIMLQSDGRIVVACHATIGNLEKFAALRYLPNGNPDNSFSSDGKVIFSITSGEDFPSSAVLQPDGKIVIAGYCQVQPANTGMAVVRILPNGNLDSGFGDNGVKIIQVSNAHEQLSDIALQPDGKLLLGGSANVNGTYHTAMARLLPNGQSDASFGQSGSIVHNLNTLGDNIQALRLQADGKIVSAGSFWIDGRHNFAVCRFSNVVPTVDNDEPAAQEAAVRLYPNPVREQAILEIDSEASGACTVDLYDLQGKRVKNLSPDVFLPAGQQKIELLFPTDLPAGRYLLLVETAEWRKSLPLVLMR